jgi:O-methyltransferase
MLGEQRFLDNVLLCQRSVPTGELVECGCWRGGMSAAMAEAVPGRKSILFDSFEGLPDPRDVDGSDARRFMDQGDRLVAKEEVARSIMERTGAAYEIIPGWFDDTVPSYARRGASIAVLRLDGDWYDSTMTCLTHLFPLVAPGGLVIIDDYYDWEGCRRAVHDFLSREQRTEALRCTRHSVVYLVKE